MQSVSCTTCGGVDLLAAQSAACTKSMNVIELNDRYYDALYAEKYRKQLEWLITMAKVPGWKAYAWGRAKELDKVVNFKGIAAELVKVMNEQQGNLGDST